jgi:hypothetical protein
LHNTIDLEFIGPYKLTGERKNIFEEEVSKSQGIYLFTIAYKYIDGFLVDYVGETGRTFRQRIKEHLIATMGGNYRICDPEKLSEGKEEIIWNGLWRKGTKNKITNFIDIYENIAPIVKRYIEIHQIFLAPIAIDKSKRRLIEGELANAFRRQKLPVTSLLPSDIRYRHTSKKLSITVTIKSSKQIFGLPTFLKI